MNRPRTNLLMLATFIVALSAGVGGGVVLSRHLSLTAIQPVSAPDHSSLAEDLQLSAEQREQMRRIWEGAQVRGKIYYDEVQKLQKGRDDEMVALLNVEQKARFEKIAHDYADRFSDLINRREAMFDDAVNETRKILNPTQRERYEQILRNRVGFLAPPQREMVPSRDSKSEGSKK